MAKQVSICDKDTVVQCSVVKYTVVQCSLFYKVYFTLVYYTIV